MLEKYFKFDKSDTIISRQGLRSITISESGSGRPYIEFRHENTYTRVFFDSDEEVDKYYDILIQTLGVEILEFEEPKPLSFRGTEI